jgi:hypothetical protein
MVVNRMTSTFSALRRSQLPVSKTRFTLNSPPRRPAPAAGRAAGPGDGLPQADDQVIALIFSSAPFGQSLPYFS